MTQAFPPGSVAVIFLSKRNAQDEEGYAQAAADMVKAAERFPGYLGIWSTRGPDGVGITISYWQSEEAALAWKADSTHAAIRDQGRARWYDWYEMVIAEVTRGYGWKRPGAGA